MKAIKKTTVMTVAAIMAVTVIGISSVQARRGGGPGGMFPRGPHGAGFYFVFHLNRMQERFGLSDNQVQKIFDIGTKYRVEYFKNRKNLPAIEKIHAEHLKEIRSVLTDDQKKIWDDIQKRRQERGPGRGMGYQPRAY